MRRRAWTILALVIGGAGVAVRWHALGRWGFSTDEAWVALMTRTTDAGQLWMSLGVSPLGWAGLVWLSHLLPARPEIALRVVPCAAGCLCLWAAYRGGVRFAAHPLGGIAAMTVLAFDPLSVGYAKFLKPYTMETLLALVALERVGAYAETGRRRDLGALCAILCLGLPFSQAHLLLGPPLLGSLVALALLRGERRRFARLVATAAAVGLVVGSYYLALIEPRMVAGLDPYWSRQTYLPASDPARLLMLLGERVRLDLGRIVGPWLAIPTVVALGAAAPTSPRRTAVALALALLVLELIGLSMARMVPVDQPRVLLFVHASLAAYGAAAVVVLGRVLARRAPLLGWSVLGLAVAAYALPHPWSHVGRPAGVEEVRTLVGMIEAQRRPRDRVLVHQSALFPYAYHQARFGGLYRAGTGAGFLPALDDPRAAIVRPATVQGQTATALRSATRVWFVGSRMQPSSVAAVRRLIEQAGRVTFERRTPGAFLFLVERRRPEPELSGSPARSRTP